MIISFVNQKGGVGKTTLSVSVAHELASAYGKKVLLIDADEQHSIIDWADARETSLPENLEVIGLPKKTIHRDISKMAERFDVVVIDTPGRIREITKSAIISSDFIVIPCTPSPYDLWAAQDAVDLVEEAQIYKENLKVAFAINRKIANTNLGSEVVAALQLLAPHIKVMDTQITQRVVFANSASNGMAIQEFDEQGKGAQEIRALTKEILEMVA